MNDLELADNKVALDGLGNLASGKGAGAAAESADNLNLVGDLGLDIVGQVVGVVAGEGLAARGGRLGADGPHLLDAVVIAGINNGRDIKVGQAVPALEGNLTEHAGDVVLAGRDGVPVANPALGDLDRVLLSTLDLERGNFSVADAGGEVDGAVSLVKRLEVDLVGSGHEGGGAEDSEDLRELHIVFWFVDVGYQKGM